MPQNFGRKLRVVVYDSKGVVSLDTDGLRVDFRVKNLQGYIRAKISIWNLNNETNKRLSSGELYIKIYVGLHDEPEHLLVKELYINNVYTEKLVPDSITNLFCVSSMQKNFTEKEIAAIVSNPSLERSLEGLALATGNRIKFNPIGFPEGMWEHIPAKSQAIMTGKVEEELLRLGKMYSFTHHVDGDQYNIVYHPNEDNLHLCKWNNEDVLILKDENMKANAQIGVATIKIKSVIDSDIKSSVLVDSSQLVTASVDASFETLTKAKNYIADNIAGDSRYRILTVEHKGSNYTKQWETGAYGVRVTKGTNLNSNNWFGGNNG